MADYDVETTVKAIPFSGKAEDWAFWSRRFLARAHVKGYKRILMGQESPMFGTVAEKERKLKSNNRAYSDLMLSCTDPVSFSAVDEALTGDLPDGDAYVAWKNLMVKFKPQTATAKAHLRLEYQRSKLVDATMDPAEWISKLERLRFRLESLGVIVDDDDFVVHILNNLPKEYDTVVEVLEPQMDSINVSALRERLRSK